ncbi:MAG: hypothetical protein SGPRY_002255 [Prymnesium sp.]
MLKKLTGANWASAKIEFDRWRASSAIFPSEVWDTPDKYHAYQWWASFGDDFAHLQTVAKRVLAQALDDILEELVQAAIDNTDNGGDEVPDAEELSGDDDDDEQFDVAAEADGDDELGSLGSSVNADLDTALTALVL